ncbi:MAG: thiamine phosphate synthase [Victivallaceae bacterium]|nr:thiamine phosphate synthase [Victivallaceae bacterium]
MTPSATRLERVEKFKKTDLYPVISSEFTDGRDVLDILKMTADGGAGIVQLREKNKSAREVYDLAAAFRRVTERYGMLLIIDDRAAIAEAVGADGVHLGQDDFPPEAARRLFPDLLIGISTHNLDEALAAERSGCDYLNIGPIFATQTKSLPMPPVGLETLDVVRAAIHVPFSVMGGIKLRHLAGLRDRGVRHVAMVTEITRAADVTAAVRELRSALI